MTKRGVRVPVGAPVRREVGRPVVERSEWVEVRTATGSLAVEVDASVRPAGSVVEPIVGRE